MPLVALGAEARVAALERPGGGVPNVAVASINDPAAGPVVLAVYDAAGRRVALLASGHHEAGEHTFRWTGRDDSGREVGSGVYFSRLETAAGALIDKMVLLR